MPKPKAAAERQRIANGIRRFVPKFTAQEPEWRWATRFVEDERVSEVRELFIRAEDLIYELAQDVASGRVALDLPDEPRPLFDGPRPKPAAPISPETDRPKVRFRDQPCSCCGEAGREGGVSGEPPKCIKCLGCNPNLRLRSDRCPRLGLPDEEPEAPAETAIVADDDWLVDRAEEEMPLDKRFIVRDEMGEPLYVIEAANYPQAKAFVKRHHHDKNGWYVNPLTTGEWVALPHWVASTRIGLEPPPESAMKPDKPVMLQCGECNAQWPRDKGSSCPKCSAGASKCFVVGGPHDPATKPAAKPRRKKETVVAT
jgi:hypothetical protein